MPNLKDMKLSEEERKEDFGGLKASDMPSYPHGLSIHLDEDTVKKLGITEPPPLGSKKILSAVVECTSVQKDNTKDDAGGFRVTLQIQQMDLQKVEENSPEKTAESLYGN